MGAFIQRPILRSGINQLPTIKLMAKFVILRQEDSLSLQLKTKPLFAKYWTSANIELSELVVDLCLTSIRHLLTEQNPSWVSLLRVWTDQNRGFAVDDVNWPHIVVDEIVNLVHDCLKVHQELAATPADPKLLTPENSFFN